jgi:TPR repeat protein
VRAWLRHVEEEGLDDSDADKSDPEKLAALGRALSFMENEPHVVRAREWCFKLARARGARSVLIEDLKAKWHERPGEPHDPAFIEALVRAGGEELRRAAEGEVFPHPTGATRPLAEASAVERLRLGYAFEKGIGREASENDAVAWYVLAHEAPGGHSYPEIRLALERIGRARRATPIRNRRRDGCMYLDGKSYRLIATRVREFRYYPCRSDARLWLARAALTGDAAAFFDLDGDFDDRP